MKIKSLLVLALASLAAASSSFADTLKLGYSDWPGYTVLEIAKQKGWFKDAGLDVDLVWFDYSASIDAFSAGKIDGDCIVAGDALGAGANSKSPSKFVCLIDYSEGSDMIVGAPGVDSIKALKGQKIGIEVGLVEHMLLLRALQVNGMTQSDVTLINTPTNNTPQTLASGKVSAIGAWYPISGQALKQVPGSKPLFTSADAKGLIYDVIAVSPTSYEKHRADWQKVTAIYYKCVDYLKDPKTHDDAVKIMAAKVGADVAEYTKAVPGTHFLTLAEAKDRIKKGSDLMSIYGSMAVSDKFNVDNKVYADPQKPESYVAPYIINHLQ
jgi:NitT/TauT family transport system substrate-binding protein